MSWPGRVMCTGSAAVAVHHGGDLVVAADLARGTLAELGAGLGDELVVGHVCSWGVESDRAVGPRRGTWHRTTGARNGPRIAPDLRPPASITDASTASRGLTGHLAGATSLAEATPRSLGDGRRDREIRLEPPSTARGPAQGPVALAEAHRDDARERAGTAGELDQPGSSPSSSQANSDREEHLGEHEEGRQGGAEQAAPHRCPRHTRRRRRRRRARPPGPTRPTCRSADERRRPTRSIGSDADETERRRGRPRRRPGPAQARTSGGRDSSCSWADSRK